MFSVVAVERNGVELVCFMAFPGSDMYRFFVNNDDMLDSRLKEKCRYLYFPVEDLEQAIEDIWRQIEFLKNNPSWEPLTYNKSIEWLDEHTIVCPKCEHSIFLGATNKKRLVFHDFCGHCNYFFGEDIKNWTELRYGTDGKVYRVRDEILFDKECEISWQEKNFFAVSLLSDIGYKLFLERKKQKMAKNSFKGINKKTITKIEKGIVNYNLRSLVKYAGLLGMEIMLQRIYRSENILNRGCIDIYWALTKLDLRENAHLFDYCEDAAQFVNYCNLIEVEIVIKERGTPRAADTVHL